MYVNVCREAYPPVERGTDESVELSAHPTPKSPLKPIPPIVTNSPPPLFPSLPCRRLFPLTSRSSIPLRTTPGCLNVESTARLARKPSNKEELLPSISWRADKNYPSIYNKYRKFCMQVIDWFRFCQLYISFCVRMKFLSRLTNGGFRKEKDEGTKEERCAEGGNTREPPERRLDPFHFHWRGRIIILIRLRLEIIPSFSALLPVFYLGLGFAHFLSDHPTFASEREHPPRSNRSGRSMREIKRDEKCLLNI